MAGIARARGRGLPRVRIPNALEGPRDLRGRARPEYLEGSRDLWERARPKGHQGSRDLKGRARLRGLEGRKESWFEGKREIREGVRVEGVRELRGARDLRGRETLVRDSRGRDLRGCVRFKVRDLRGAREIQTGLESRETSGTVVTWVSEVACARDSDPGCFPDPPGSFWAG